MARRTAAAANAAADAAVRLLDGGYLRIYDGDRGLVELRFGVPAFRAARGGIARAESIAAARAQATGTAQTFEAVSAAGRLVLSGRIGIDLVLDRTYIEAGATVSVSSFTYTEALA